MNILVVLLVIQTASSYTIKDWCDRSCGKTRNVVCTRKSIKCQPNPKCGTDIQSGMSNSDRYYVLRAHNEIRNKFAGGKETRINNQSFTVSDMKLLNYDMELEFSAQCWANACSIPKDICISTPSFGKSIGQNFYHASEILEGNKLNVGPDLLKLKWSDVVKSWYEHILRYHHGNMYKSGSRLRNTDFATQIIWANTTLLGCSKVSFYKSNRFYMHIFCNYYLKGNVEGHKIYEIGKPCSGCGKCSWRYRNLCGGLQQIKPFSSPFDSQERTVFTVMPDRIAKTTDTDGKRKDEKPMFQPFSASCVSCNLWCVKLVVISYLSVSI